MSDSETIYLDHHATTPCDQRVVGAMLPWITDRFANAGSLTHPPGQLARDEVERCRALVAGLIGAARPSEIVFTSGATESNNLALSGVAARAGSGHFISVATEHPSVLEPLRRLTRRGFEVTLLPVLPDGDPRAGLVDLNRLVDAIRPDTRLVSVMLANNEIGVIQPLPEIAAICRARGILVHTDATQAVGKLPVDVNALDVDLMSFTAHKLYGPKGVGALFVRGSDRRVRLEPQIVGGGQEEGRRSGTLNVPGIVGLAAALELAAGELELETARIRGLRNRLWSLFLEADPGVRLNGPDLSLEELRLAGNLNCRFPGVAGHTVMIHCTDVALSSGSACSATSSEPSHVLQALGMDDDAIRSSLRFGVGRFNSDAEIGRAAARIVQAVRGLRSLGSSGQVPDRTG